MTPDELARKFGGVPVEGGADTDALARKFGGQLVAATNPAAADPEVVTPLGTIKGDVGGNLALNPAAAIIGAGDWLSKINRGMFEAKHAPVEWITGRKSPFMESVRQDRAFAEQPMKELEAVHPGSVGTGTTLAMAAVPPALLPFVAAAEEGSVGERATRAGATLAGQAAAKAAGSYLAKAPERAAKAQTLNQVRDDVVQRAREAGYVFPPSATGGGGVSRFFEGLSGKAKTEQLGMVKNQPVTDKLARMEMGLADDAPLVPETFQAVRAKAYEVGYKPVADVPLIQWDKPFIKGLSKLSPNSAGGAVKNPAAAEIDDLVTSLAGQKQWTGEQIVRDIQSLREQARANFTSAARDGGNVAKTELARAQSEAAEMLENLASRRIKPGAIDALRAARRTIAKSHDIEDALVNGSVDLMKVKGGPQSTGYLRLMAELGGDKALRKSVGMPASGAGNPISVLDAFGVAGLAGMGAGPMSVALPAVRVGSRYGILSKPAQRFARPDYSRSVVSRGAPLLDNPYAPALTGMFGYDLTR